MTDDTRCTAPSSLLNPEALSRYLVRDRREVAAIMTGLVEKRSLVTVHLDGGLHFISAMLEVTPGGESIILDASPHKPTNDKATTAREVVCAAMLDRIRIQFSLPGLEQVQYNEALALRAALPEAVLRLQRRESFRLMVPVSDSVTCLVAMEGGGTSKSISAKVLDISSGGVAILISPEEFPVSQGMTLEECRLSLPETEAMAVRLKVRNQLQVDRSNGRQLLRVGCEFIDLGSKDAARIQRYIFKVERDRKAREAGYL